MPQIPPKFPIKDQIRQSPPIDFSIPFDSAWVKDKTIVITGGASGFGEGFFKKWASNGANVIIGDINVARGDQLVRDVRGQTNNQNLHFVECDVTSWESQVHFFKEAVRLSPHGGIDAVVVNAGITEKPPTFGEPKGLDGPSPPKPDFSCINVNLIGALWTTHLAIFYLPRNPTSKSADHSLTPSASNRDRHILLVGSIASLGPIAGQTLYGVTKHGVLGLFRCLRTTSFVSGIRVNLICPYFMDTPLLNGASRTILAGIPYGKVEDVVDAADRLMCDTRIVGRSICIGPKVNFREGEDGEWSVVPKDDPSGKETAMWEAYADDYEDSEIFTRRVVGIMNAVVAIRGRIGIFYAFVGGLTYNLRRWWKGQ